MVSNDFEDLLSKTNELLETNNLFMINGNIQKLKKYDITNDIKVIEAKYLKKMYRMDESLRLVNEVINDDKQNVEALRLRGAIYMSMGEKNLGCNDFEAAYNLKNNDNKLMMSFSRALVSCKRYEEAREIYKKLIHYYKSDDIIDIFQSTNNYIVDKYENYNIELSLKERLSLARSYYELSEVDKALEEINKIENVENNYEAVLLLCNIYLRKKQYKKVLYYAERGLELEKENPKSYFYIANVYEKDNEYDKALDYYNKAIEIDKNYNIVYGKMANLLVKMGRDKEAIDIVNKFEYLNYDKEILLNIKGKALFYLGQYEEAKENYDKAIEVSPRYLQVYINKSILYRQEENYRDAYEICEKAISMGYQFEQLFIEKGIILREVGQCENALEWIEWALEIDSSCSLGVLSKAICLCHMKEYLQAEKVLEDLDKLEPHNIINICAKVFLYYCKEQIEECTRLIKDYMQSDDIEEKNVYMNFVEKVKNDRSELKNDNFHVEVINIINSWIEKGE